MNAPQSNQIKTNQNKIVSKKNRRRRGQKNTKARVVKKKALGSINNFQGQVNSMFKKGIGRTLSSIPEMQEFGKAITNPYDRSLSPAIPIFPIQASQKVVCWAIATGKTNANGIGYVGCAPINGISSQAACMVVSDGTNLDDYSPPNGMQPINSNSMYAFDSFQYNTGENENTHSARPVAVGIRVRYTGTNLNKGGRIFVGINPNRLNNSFGFQMTELSAWTGMRDLPVDNEWHGVQRHIDRQEDFLFQSFNKDTGAWCYNNDQTMISLDNMPNMVIFIQTSAGSQPFQVEFVGHYEVIGRNLPNSSIVMPHDDLAKKLVTAHKIISQTGPSDQELIPTITKGGKSNSVLDSIEKGVGIMGHVLDFF